jgi:Site-specific recombinase XerC
MAKRTSHGNGTIYQRSDGRWTGQMTVAIDPITKKQKRKTVYAKTKREVQEKLLILQYQKHTTGFISTDKTTVGAWLDKWLEVYAKPHLRTKTWESYGWLIRVHLKPSIGEIVLSKLQTSDVQQMYNAKLRTDEHEGVSARTIRYMHSILGAAIKQAVRENLVARNVVAFAKPPSSQKAEMHLWNSDQVKIFLDKSTDNRFYPVFLLALGCGMRRGEIIGLQWQDVDLDNGIVHIQQSLVTTNSGLKMESPKTPRSRRAIPLPEEVVKALKHLRLRQNEEKIRYRDIYQDDGFVFTWEQGKVIDPNYITHLFARLATEAGLPAIRFHDLRHLHATNLLELGVNPKVVQERLGHSSITVTMDIYSHVSKGMQESASVLVNGLLAKMVKTPNFNR